MFGKPDWFRPRTIGWGLAPVTWQGWLYTSGWTGAMVLPFLLLIGRQQPLEAGAWMGLMMGALTYDVWQLRGAIRGPSAAAASALAKAQTEDNVLYILDSQPGQPVATRNYNLHVRA